MELFFGRHARAQMLTREITEEMARAVVEVPDRELAQQRRKVVYYGVAGGRAIAVVVAYDHHPPFVVTVMDDWSAG